MSTPAFEDRYGAELQRLTTARDEALTRLASHERASAEKSGRLAAIEAAYVANATSEALGFVPTEEVPDADAFQRLRADVTVSEPVRQQLALRLEKAEAELQEVESKRKAAVGEHIRVSVLEPALAELDDAFEALKQAAVNVMAAHYLGHRKFKDDAPPPMSVLDLHGPVAELLASMRMMNWPNFPYDIRPEWLPRHGRFYPDEMRGVQARTDEILAEIAA